MLLRTNELKELADRLYQWGLIGKKIPVVYIFIVFTVVAILWLFYLLWMHPLRLNSQTVTNHNISANSSHPHPDGSVATNSGDQREFLQALHDTPSEQINELASAVSVVASKLIELEQELELGQSTLEKQIQRAKQVEPVSTLDTNGVIQELGGEAFKEEAADAQSAFTPAIDITDKSVEKSSLENAVTNPKFQVGGIKEPLNPLSGLGELNKDFIANPVSQYASQNNVITGSSSGLRLGTFGKEKITPGNLTAYVTYTSGDESTQTPKPSSTTNHQPIKFQTEYQTRKNCDISGSEKIGVYHSKGLPFFTIGSCFPKESGIKTKVVSAVNNVDAIANLPNQKHQNKTWAPTGSVFTNAINLTSLIGRVPSRGEVVDPVPFKIVLTDANFALRGQKLSGFKNALVTGDAVGDLLLSCVRGRVKSISWANGQGEWHEARDDNGLLGYITDSYGNACIHGKVITSLYRGAGLSALFGALNEASSARSTASSLAIRNFTDAASINDIAELGAIEGGADAIEQWVGERLKESFDAVVVPPGQILAVHLQKALVITK